MATGWSLLRLIARELYKVIGEETRRLAPDVLILGALFAHDHPDCVIEEALPYIDVLSIQPGGCNSRQPILTVCMPSSKPILV